MPVVIKNRKMQKAHNFRRTLDEGVKGTLICKNCGGTEWGYTVTYTTPFNAATGVVGTRKQTCEELRCIKCGRKAYNENNEALRALPIFGDVKSIEIMGENL